MNCGDEKFFDFNEILNRAANSTLTPTAAEFVPRSTLELNNGVTDDCRDPCNGQTTCFGNEQNNTNENLNNTKAGKSRASDSESEGNFPNLSEEITDFNFSEENRNCTENSYVRNSTAFDFRKLPNRFKQRNSEALRFERYGGGSNWNYSANDRFKNNRLHNSRVNSCSASFYNKYAQHKNNGQFSCNSKFDKKLHKKQFQSQSNSNNIEQNTDLLVCQRDTLIEQLTDGSLECLVCCERIKQREPTWSCGKCYHVLHFWCTVRWAKSSKCVISGIWRCPACQNENTNIPEHYTCFCGTRRLQTEWNRIDIPHSCGELCNRVKNNSDVLACQHECTLLCHPGPCPVCTVHIDKQCGCGKITKIVQCGSVNAIVCGNICDKILNCQVHRCADVCHEGECKPCSRKIKIDCYCEKSSKEETCGSDASICSRFCCGLMCGKKLACGNHACQKICHEGDCEICDKLPTVVNTCFCGKTKFETNTRSSCLEPLPICDKICGKLLPCGSPSRPHFCQMKCHEGSCNPCDKETTIKCGCGSNTKSVRCVDLSKSVNDFRCKKRCTKKRICGKHKCNKICCIDLDHVCPLKCSGTLSCGKHRCDHLCHFGKCGNCLETSFDDLFCSCGNTVIYAPIPCGQKPPHCDYPCSRVRTCGHPCILDCHLGDCPPCIAFTDKLCYGGHELRSTIPCNQTEFSCGLPCGKLLPCGLHVCVKTCHPGDCLKSDETCEQPCAKERSLCGHPCSVPCHPSEETCPNTRCLHLVKVTCICENLVENHHCFEHTADFENIISSITSKMDQLQFGHSVNMTRIIDQINQSRRVLKVLQCNEECSLIMRNRHLAMCLQIQNPDLSSKLVPRYSDFMKQWGKKDPSFCQHVHDKLTSLVKLSKESKHKSRSHSFEVMNKEKRQFVHEYCAHFGCESQAYDAEPKRNVVVTAMKEKCWLPAYSLIEVVQREMGQRKVPVPFFNRNKNTSVRTGSNDISSNMIIMPILRNNSS